MASKRRLKKEIGLMTSQLIGDCIDVLDTFDDKKDLNLLSIIEEAVILNNTILDRASHPEGKANSALVKQHYRKIKGDFMAGLEKAYGKLEGSIVK